RRLWAAARYAVWLAGRPEAGGAAYADSALVLANTAVEADSARVEGYYYRALATGFVARANPLTGRSAMRRIREDASRALALDSAFDAGGPHRALGALYLRAPGPPVGVGSLNRAVQHLEAAHRIAPEHPDNLLFLAEAYLDAGRAEEARRLLDRAAAIEAKDPGEEEWRRAWARELRDRLRSGAR
ncbi:MAG: tetratricopeptide repeat protein, partial [Gemmatimonadota bacterium]|nr:tetratricopeptide repeat protein [Gemmatimonadota bacterium]